MTALDANILQRKNSLFAIIFSILALATTLLFPSDTSANGSEWSFTRHPVLGFSDLTNGQNQKLNHAIGKPRGCLEAEQLAFRFYEEKYPKFRETAPYEQRSRLWRIHEYKDRGANDLCVIHSVFWRIENLYAKQIVQFDFYFCGPPSFPARNEQEIKATALYDELLNFVEIEARAAIGLLTLTQGRSEGWFSPNRDVEYYLRYKLTQLDSGALNTENQRRLENLKQELSSIRLKEVETAAKNNDLRKVINTTSSCPVRSPSLLPSHDQGRKI